MNYVSVRGKCYNVGDCEHEHLNGGSYLVQIPIEELLVLVMKY